MATFSTNQVRQFYVANATCDEAKSSISAMTSVGDWMVVYDDDVDYSSYLLIKGADGTILRSDAIRPSSAVAQVTSASSLARALKVATVTLDSNVNNGEPVAGQDYIVRVNVRQYVGLSDEETAVKIAHCRATSGMTATQLYAALASSLIANLSKELAPLFTITSSASGLVITEVEQPYVRGTMASEPVYFDVTTNYIVSGGDETAWASVAISNGSSINDGKLIADLEYFCLGERGDIYRGVSFPNVIPTNYQVNPASAYAVLDITFSYEGAAEDVQKSPKTLTVVSTSEDVLNAIKNAIID